MFSQPTWQRMLLLEGPQTYGHSLKDSILGTAFEDWDSQSLSKLIDLMVEVGADLNSSFVTREPYQHYQRYGETPLGTVVHTSSRAVTKRLLDAVVKRGDIKTTKRLLDAGALLTTTALSFAVESGNEILVRFLINQGADVSAECSVEDVGTPTQASTCPLAAAVRLQKESMVGIILVHVDTKALCSPHVFRSTWQAAVEVNSSEWIRRLLAVSAEMAPACLGYALDIAAEHGLRDVAFCLLDSGADVTNWARTPALLSALQQEDRVLVYALLERDAIQDRNRENFLEAALLWGDHDVILAVVSATLRVGDRLREPETATVAIFARRRNYRLMDVLIEAGLNINHHYPSREASLLTTAAKDNDIELVKFWLDRGAKDTDGSAFTHALGQSEEILELLMENLARSQPREWQLSGARALKAAIDADKLTVFLKLLNRGANANARGTLYGFMRERNMMLSPFGHAVRAGPRKGIRFVERLLQDVLISNCTPESIVDSRILEVSRLCRREPESKQAIVAMTAMLEALRIKSYSMVSLMLRHGANINQPATNGVKRTPLQMATEVGSLDLVKLLLEKGADVDGLPALRNGASALQLAAAGGHLSIARLLLQKGASIDLPLPPFSLQPLEVAAYHGRLDMVALLLSTASYFYDPVKGPLKKQLRSATSLAKEEGYYYIVDMLKQYMRTGKVFVTQSKGTELFNFNAEPLVEYDGMEPLGDDANPIIVTEVTAVESSRPSPRTEADDHTNGNSDSDPPIDIGGLHGLDSNTSRVTDADASQLEILDALPPPKADETGCDNAGAELPMQADGMGLLNLNAASLNEGPELDTGNLDFNATTFTQGSAQGFDDFDFDAASLNEGHGWDSDNFSQFPLPATDENVQPLFDFDMYFAQAAT